MKHRYMVIIIQHQLDDIWFGTNNEKYTRRHTKDTYFTDNPGITSFTMTRISQDYQTVRQVIIFINL